MKEPLIYLEELFIGRLNTILSEHLSKAIESEKLVFSITVMNIQLNKKGPELFGAFLYSIALGYNFN